MKKDQNNNFRKRDVSILIFILLVSLIFRLYKINTPLADFFSWRQVDTAAVARNFTREKFDLLHPMYDDFSNIQSGKDNPRGLRMVEFPLYQASFASLYKANPQIPLEVYGRTISIFFSLIVIAVIYYFLLKETGRNAAIIGSLTYAIFPFFVFFSRVVLPETMALALTFLSLFFLYLFAHGKTRRKNIIYFFFAIVFFSLGLLVKPTVIFYSIAALYLFFRKYRFHFATSLLFYAFFALSFIPLLLWRYHISFFPEGIPSSYWLLTKVNTPEGLQSVFFRPAFFRWIFFERINNIIFGGLLTFLFLLGALTRSKKYFLHFILLSALAYLFVFQGGNVQHEYYQTLILPPLAIFVGVGTVFIVNNARLFLPQAFMYVSLFLIFALSLFFSYYRVKDYYNFPQELVNISRIINDISDEDDKIVTDTIGDTTLLYLSQRRGSPAPYKDFAILKAEGYKYFVTLNAEVINNLKLEGKEVVASDEHNKFAIFRL